MTLTIEKPKKEGLSDRVRDLQTQVGDGSRKPPKKPPHTAVATGGKDDESKKRINEIKERMELEDWKAWEEEFDAYKDGLYE